MPVNLKKKKKKKVTKKKVTLPLLENDEPQKNSIYLKQVKDLEEQLVK